MKAIFDIKTLRETLENALLFATKKIIGVSSYFLLEADKDSSSFKISAHTTSSAFTSTLRNVDIESSGTALVRAESLVETVKNVKSTSEILLELRDNKLFVTNPGKKKFEMALSSIDPSKFESSEKTIPKDEIYNFSIKANKLCFMFDKTKITVGKDTTRHFLTGIYIEREPDDESSLVMVATDGKGLSKYTASSSFDEHDMIFHKPGNFSAIFPLWFASAIAKIATDDSPVHIAVEGAKILVRYKNYQFYTYSISGNFPDYQRVIPSTFKSSITFSKNEMLEALKIVEKNSAVDKAKIFLDIHEGELRIKSKLEDSDFEYIIETEYSDEPITIAVFENIFAPFFTKIESPDAIISFNGKYQPIMITDNENPELTFIQMPLQV